MIEGNKGTRPAGQIQVVRQFRSDHGPTGKTCRGAASRIIADLNGDAAQTKAFVVADTIPSSAVLLYKREMAAAGSPAGARGFLVPAGRRHLVVLP
jgi:hypothetical protein